MVVIDLTINRSNEAYSISTSEQDPMEQQDYLNILMRENRPEMVAFKKIKKLPHGQRIRKREEDLFSLTDDPYIKKDQSDIPYIKLEDSERPVQSQNLDKVDYNRSKELMKYLFRMNIKLIDQEDSFQGTKDSLKKKIRKIRIFQSERKVL
jgi:hypothetical protein